MPQDLLNGEQAPKEFKTVDQLIEEGAHLAELEKLRWKKGQAAKQCAYLCFSSGTSGLPVCVPHAAPVAEHS
jgi:acyl-coenzyme A synthetase/AMP-(fatty) acid ligase